MDQSQHRESVAASDWAASEYWRKVQDSLIVAMQFDDLPKKVRETSREATSR